MLHSEAEALKISDREKLDEWYKLDENAMPPVYLLQVCYHKNSDTQKKWIKFEQCGFTID